MTATSARAAAGQLRVALLDNGVRRVSIELQPGVGPKSDPWGVAPFVRGLGHHIASYPTQGRTPGLGVVKDGRGGKSPLQGPLANCYGGYDLTARIITMGWANHPGEGGPWAVPGWGTVPRDNGRPYTLGWEFEGGYLPYTDEMHHFMACCGAGTLDWLGWLNNRAPAPLECWGEHKDPWAPGRKVDRIGYTAASGRARIAAVRGTTGTPQEDDMSVEAERQIQSIHDLLGVHLAPAIGRIDAHAATDYPFVLYQDTDPTSDHRTLAVLAAPGVWWPVPSTTPEADYMMVIRHLRLAGQVVEVPARGWWAFAEQMWMLRGATLNVDTAAVEAKIDGLLGNLDEEAFAAIARVVNDEDDRRDRDGDAATGALPTGT